MPTDHGGVGVSRRYSFSASYGDWPFNTPARKAVIKVTDQITNKEQKLYLTPADARALLVESARALAFTKTPRPEGQHEKTWQSRVSSKIEPLVAVTNALLPKSNGK